MKVINASLLLFGVLSLSSTISAAEVAGAKPHERPANAPVQSTVVRDNAWFAQALTGINSPYPNSLRFLESQGNWYTPFVYAGMPGRYNLRNW